MADNVDGKVEEFRDLFGGLFGEDCINSGWFPTGEIIYYTNLKSRALRLNCSLDLKFTLDDLQEEKEFTIPQIIYLVVANYFF